MSTQGLTSPIRWFSVFVQWVMQVTLLCGLLFSLQVHATDKAEVNTSLNAAPNELTTTPLSEDQAKTKTLAATQVADSDVLPTPSPTDSAIQTTTNASIKSTTVVPVNEPPVKVLPVKALPVIADAIYFGGDILTMEGALPSYTEAVATKDKKIIFVGTKIEAMKLSGDNTKLINISGKTMLPGFIEPHVHPSIAAIMLPNEIIAPYDWVLPHEVKKGVSGHFAYLERLKQSIDANAEQDKVFFVWGYHQLWHGELTRAMLNELSPDKPVAVIHRSFHEVFLNDAAIKKFGLKQADFADNPQVDWQKGHFYEGGWLALVPKISADLINPESYKLGLNIMSKLVLKNGITTIAEPGFPSSNFDLEYQLLKSEMDQQPPYDVFLIPSGSYLYNAEGRSNENALAFIETLADKYNTDNIKFLPKQVKLFADGAIYSQLMQMKDGYLDGHEGEWMTPLALFQQQLSFYWQQGYQIHVHANGDLGIQQVLDFNQADQAKLAREDHRFTLHHMGYFNKDQVKQLVDLGIETSVNPYYLWALADKYSEVGLGSERAENLVRVNSLMKSKVPVSFHSDFSMAPMEPLTLAWTAVNRQTSELNKVSQEERISAYQAMQAITINAAHTLRLEASIGSISVGKTANFTLLEQNPLKVTPMQIKDIPVWGVVFEDQVNTVAVTPKKQNLEVRVIYLERTSLPASSTITVTLEDISKTDISSSMLGQKTIAATTPPPYNISLQYDPTQFDNSGEYVVRARIENNGKPLYSATLDLPEFNQLSGQLFELIVKAIPPPPITVENDLEPELQSAPAQ
ncbi:MAG: amidohydrolase family protein [Moritella sp.]|uniref:amidohydrolase family protein n=1 Tax=Moritella sp. TaxID=78556 RepID=UPI0029A85DC9|nr:amidohydrolase family protein [Moritella sp.]MDX2319906.1 amidohydrolase family protein [Moritella sp.]